MFLPMNSPKETPISSLKGSPVQQAADKRRVRVANALRENLKRRKQAAQSMLAEPPPAKDTQGS